MKPHSVGIIHLRNSLPRVLTATVSSLNAGKVGFIVLCSTCEMGFIVLYECSTFIAGKVSFLVLFKDISTGKVGYVLLFKYFRKLIYITWFCISVI